MLHYNYKRTEDGSFRACINPHMAPQELGMGGQEEAAEWVTPEVSLSFPDAQEFDTGVVQ